MEQKMLDSKIIIALDYSERKLVHEITSKLDPKLCKLKVGKQLFTKYGPTIVRELQSDGFDIFLDLKFHDIPTTVYKATAEALELGVWMLNIHALGGKKMMEEAVRARDSVNKKALMIGVSILTSLGDDSLSEIGLDKRNALVKKLSNQVYECGLDGVVCSPSDIDLIGINEEKFLYVTPGIRLESNKQDHNNSYTPVEACNLGSNYLVIGRPITTSLDPLNTINSILKLVK